MIFHALEEVILVPWVVQSALIVGVYRDARIT